MTKKKTIGWMCIPIKKVSEDIETVEYQFSADIYEPNPDHRQGTIVVGQAHEILSLDKASGEVFLLKEMPGDNDKKRFYRAARRIKQHWELKEYPDSTIFACG